MQNQSKREITCDTQLKTALKTIIENDVLESFSNDDGDGSENVTFKMN